MQSTLAQFFNVHKEAKQLKKENSLRACVDCHFSKKLHGSSGVTDPEFFRRYFQFYFQFEPDNKLQPKGGKLLLKIQIKRIGHELPTGDLFRQIRILAYNPKNQNILQHIIAKDVEYYFEGKIDHIIKNDMTDKDRKITLYDGSCQNI